MRYLISVHREVVSAPVPESGFLTMSDMIKIQPIQRRVDADVSVPGSKSYTNRALLIAALANGRSRLSGALESDDTRYMADALSALGVRSRIESEGAVIVDGAGGRIPVPNARLFVGNSGTAARFLTGYISLGCGEYTLDGDPRMRERPIQDLMDALRPLGVRARSLAGNGCPPIVVHGAGLEGGRTELPGNRSSQYLSALLMVAPYARQDVKIRVTGNLVSRPYIDMTVRIMRDFGVHVGARDASVFHVKAGQRYTPSEYSIEPDASNASYFFAAAALTGGRIKVRNLSPESAQGDLGFVDVLGRMGCAVSNRTDGIEVRGPERLSGIDVDMNAMPDVVQTLCALAPFAAGPVTARNIANLRIKETDRIAAIATELTRLGVRAVAGPDFVTVYPSSRIRPAEIDTYEDHRMAMSMALIGLKTPGIAIRNPACVDKSFPSYFQYLDKLRR